ncbi:MAG: peptidylprolyl isomerase [Planctomycetes bacterium]|nr:peptidylprolyl isomerase [Planctomycetota bacterium]
MLLTALRERVAQHEVEALQAAVDLAGVAGARAELQHWATCTEPSLRTRALALLQQRPLGVNPTAVAVRSNTATLVTKVSRPVASAPELITPAAGATAVATESQAVLLTTRGKITLTLFQKEAPATVANFVALTQRGFYDGIMFHRRVPGFVAQAGCPRGDGSGGPGHSIPCELNARTFKRGTLGMALAGKDTGGSQWFLCLADAPHLDGRYTVFGGVESGWDVMDALSEDDQILGIQILASAVR